MRIENGRVVYQGLHPNTRLALDRLRMVNTATAYSTEQGLAALSPDDLERYAYIYASTPLEKALLKAFQESSTLESEEIAELRQEVDTLESQVSVLHEELEGVKEELESANTRLTDMAQAFEGREK